MSVAAIQNETSIVVENHPVRGPAQRFAKRFVQGGCLLLVLPRIVWYQLARRILQREAFVGASASIARVPGLWGVYQRQAYYSRVLAGCGRDVYFGWMSTFSMPQAVVGDRAYIGSFCSIGYAEIGSEAMLADRVCVLSGGSEHGREQDGQTMHEQAQTFRKVLIGRGAWIGAGAVVMADVGEGAIVGAGAVVTKPIPDRCVAVGVPARVVKRVGQ